MSKFILRHPVLWTSFSFLFIFLPQWLASVWSLFSPDPLVKIIYSKVGLTMPTFSSYWISIPIGFLMFGYLIYEQHFRKVPELGEIVQRKNNLKIEIEDIEITTSHSRGKDGESFIQEKQILKVTISLLPSMKMQIAKILLHMDDKIIEPSGPPIYAS
ncbi:MAG TPA: hypothetical protein VLY20_00385, partial [Nitrospiria bacterium]|nr:hypothetical protein [Nitrospiria bacterium]